MKEYQANQIMQLVKDKYFNIMNEEIVFIETSNKFSYCEDVIGYTITIVSKLKDNSFVRFITEKGLNDECNMMEGIDEVICLLHEIGHFHNDITTGITNKGYEEFKKTVYYSHYQADKAYRNIPAEDYADRFAVNFINENIRRIWKIMNPKMDYSEIDKWIEMFK